MRHTFKHDWVSITSHYCNVSAGLSELCIATLMQIKSTVIAAGVAEVFFHSI